MLQETGGKQGKRGCSMRRIERAEMGMCTQQGIADMTEREREIWSRVRRTPTPPDTHTHTHTHTHTQGERDRDREIERERERERERLREPYN
jgi:hypothetical protein